MAWWPILHNTIDDLFTAIETRLNLQFAFRGLPDSSYNLLSTLDRILPKEWPYERRLAEESAIIVKFCSLAADFCDHTEQAYLQGPVPHDRIKALRLLDWTASPLVALYFAAISDFDRDGSIWWFDRKEFEEAVGRRWQMYGLKRYPELDNGVNLNDTAFGGDGPPWISLLTCMVPFHRIEVQHGFFTMAGRLRIDHAELISNLLSEDKYGVILIPSLWKRQIIDRLRSMKIHSKSIDYPGADLIGMKLAQEVSKLNPISSNPSH
jgi:hypothetical protein